MPVDAPAFRVNLLVIRAADLDRAQRFYEALGLKFTTERHGTGPQHLAATLDGTTFEIYPQGKTSSNGTRLGFVIPNVDAALKALAPLECEIISPPADSPWGRRAVVADPDGHRVELTQ